MGDNSPESGRTVDLVARWIWETEVSFRTAGESFLEDRFEK